MSVIASAQITLSWQPDIDQAIYYYKKQSSTSAAPSKPTSYPPTGWSTTEPTYSSGETSTLYVTICTLFSDGTFDYSDVTVSSSFEAAKQAYNKAVAAEQAAGTALTAANGKNKLFYQNAEPTSGMSEGDLWFDTDGGNAIWEYKKTSSSPETYAWTKLQLGQGAIAANSITAAEINVANLSAIKAIIGGWNIGTTAGTGQLNGSLYYGTFGAANSIYLIPAGATQSKAIAGRTGSDWVITAGANFGVSKTGVLYASGAQISGKFVSTNGSESCTIDSDALGAFVSAENAVTSIRISANNDGSVGLYEVIPIQGGGDLVDTLLERTGNGLYTPQGIAIGFPGTGVLANVGMYLENEGYISFAQARDHALLVNKYNDTDYNLIRNHNNGNISISASSGALYLGYENTAFIDLMKGSYYLNTYSMEITNANSPVWLRVRNGVGGNAIFIQANTTGTVELASYSANGTRYGILARANNSNSITTYGTWTFTSSIVSSNSSGQAIVYASNSGTGNRIFIYADASNGWVGLYSYDANNTSRPILVRANNSNAITAYGAWTFNSGVVGYNNTGRPVVSIDTNTARCSMLSASGSSTLQVTGQWNSSTYSVKNITVSSSDVRLKENIRECTLEALPIVNAIRIREFDWIGGDHQRIGVIADELEKLDDKLTVGGGYTETGEMNVKSVDTFYLLGYAIKAIQELSAEIDKLKGAA